MQDYEQHCLLFNEQSKDLDNSLQAFHTEVEALSASLHLSVKNVIDELLRVHLEMTHAANAQQDSVQQQLRELQEALQTAHTLRSMMNDFHTQFTPKKLLSDCDNDEDNEAAGPGTSS
jgi:predicted component of type VI protein secretion system